MEGAVSVTVCSMSVIIPAILRVLGVGDPFMREDTVDPNISTGVEIARVTTTRLELGLLNTCGAAIADSDESKGVIDTVTSRRPQDSVGLDVKGDRKHHQLTTQTSNRSLGNSSMTMVSSLTEECDIPDSLAPVGSLPTVREDRNIEADVEGKNARRNST